MYYKIIDEGKVPQEIKNWLEENRHTENHTIIHLLNKTYVLITRGEMKTGGYDIELEKMNNLNNKIMVIVKYIDPDPEQIVLQSITYPTLIIELEKTDAQILIVLQKSEEKK